MVSWQKDNEQSQRHTLEVKVISEAKADSDSDADAAIELRKIILLRFFPLILKWYLKDFYVSR